MYLKRALVEAASAAAIAHKILVAIYSLFPRHTSAQEASCEILWNTLMSTPNSAMIHLLGFAFHQVRRNIRYEAVSVDQLFNSGEKRTARIRLLLAHAARKDSELESGDSCGNGGHNASRVSFL